MQHGNREHLHLLGMALEQDLSEDRPGQVVSAPAIANFDLLALKNQILQVLKRDVFPGLAVVEPAVGVPLDGDDFRRRTRHGSPLVASGMSRSGNVGLEPLAGTWSLMSSEFDSLPRF